MRRREECCNREMKVIGKLNTSFPVRDCLFYSPPIIYPGLPMLTIPSMNVYLFKEGYWALEEFGLIVGKERKDKDGDEVK